MASDAELAAMRHAITLSALGMGTTSPNPPVGCVILNRRGIVVGAGFHRRKGEGHAEVNALAQAGTAARDGTAIVTLEPCNHVGVSPACRQELLDAGITRVVVGVIDPTSRGNGGAADLAAAGVDVEVGVLHNEVLAVLGPWQTATIRRRPYVVLAHASQGGHGPKIDEQLALHLRGGADVVVVNKGAEEGVPGGHAPQHFTLPGATYVDAGILPWLSDAYAAGARSVLLVGTAHAEALRHDMRAVDEVALVLRRVDPPGALTTADPQLIPLGFQLVAVTAFNDSLMVRFQRPEQLQT